MEHNFTQETRVRRTHQKGREVEYEQTRWVCTCGYYTSWSGDGVRARRQKDGHNLDGQLEHSAAPPWPDRVFAAKARSRLRVVK